MNIDGIIAVSGKPGLYKVIGQTKNGVIVTSLSDGKKLAMSSSSKMSALQDIAIYTYAEEIPLVDVLEKIRIKEDGKAAIGHKSSAAVLTDYFRTILDDYDEDRVYPSDIKKVISWYNTLQREGLAVESVEEEAPEEVKEKKEEKKPKAKAKAKTQEK
ncbi:MAG: DUF5606 domain-containing protein [Flavobacteriales bacterium]|nr:DUF5606 domain-containing protein [Flavobacteriales bacterium]